MPLERAVVVVLDPAELVDIFSLQTRLEEVKLECLAQTAAVVRDFGDVSDADVRPALVVPRGVARQQDVLAIERQRQNELVLRQVDVQLDFQRVLFERLRIPNVGQLQNALVVAALAGEVQHLHPLALQNSVDVTTCTHTARGGLGGTEADAGLQRRVPLDRDLVVSQGCIARAHAIKLPYKLDLQVLGEPFVLVDKLLARRSETQAASCLGSDNVAEFQRLLTQQEIIDLLRADDQFEGVDGLAAFVFIQSQIENCIAIQCDREIGLGAFDSLVVQRFEAVVFREMDQQQVEWLL